MKKIITLLLIVTMLFSTAAIYVGCSSNSRVVDGVKITTASYSGTITGSSVEEIKKLGVLVVATAPDFPPFEYLDGRHATGWDIDVAAAMAKKLGVDLWVNTMDFDSVIGAPAGKKCHIAMAGLSVSAEREKVMDFTKGIFDSSQVIVVKNDNTTINNPMDLADKKVGAQRGTVGHLLAQLDKAWAFDNGVAILGTPSQALAYDNGAMAIQALANGSVDAVILDKFPAQKFVEANAGKVKIVADSNGKYASVFDDEYAFGVDKGSPLKDVLNGFIVEFGVKGGVFEQINTKYFG